MSMFHYSAILTDTPCDKGQRLVSSLFDWPVSHRREGPTMPEKSGDVKRQILAAAWSLVSERGGDKATISDIAAAAGCAKGLVHYHFGTKKALMFEVASATVMSRTKTWTDALDQENPQTAIDRSWELLRGEAKDGTVHAWAATVDRTDVTDRSVKNQYELFSSDLGASVARLLTASGFIPSVPDEELGALLGSVVHGIGKMLVAGMDEALLEAAYAATWIGILSLTRPAS